MTYHKCIGYYTCDICKKRMNKPKSIEAYSDSSRLKGWRWDLCEKHFKEVLKRLRFSIKSPAH